MSAATITTKGQVTIPKEIRELLGVEPGDRVLFWRNPEGQIVVEPETVSLMSLHGMLKGLGPTLSVEEMDAAITQATVEGNR